MSKKLLNGVATLFIISNCALATQDYGYRVSLLNPIDHIDPELAPTINSIESQIIDSNGNIIEKNRYNNGPLLSDYLVTGSMYFTNELIGSETSYVSFGTDLDLRLLAGYNGLGGQCGFGFHFTILENNKIENIVHVGAIGSSPLVSASTGYSRILESGDRISIAVEANAMINAEDTETANENHDSALISFVSLSYSTSSKLDDES